MSLFNKNNTSKERIIAFGAIIVASIIGVFGYNQLNEADQNKADKLKTTIEDLILDEDNETRKRK
jgi:hypothetical protein